jgi:RNA recognition motif-containing protein
VLQPCGVYVGNLAPSTTRVDLEALFERFGPIRDVRLVTSSSGQCRGFGFVDFASAGLAEKAIATLHNTTFHSTRIIVGKARHRYGDSPRRHGRPPEHLMDRAQWDERYWSDPRRYYREARPAGQPRDRPDIDRRDYNPYSYNYDRPWGYRPW